MGVDMCGWVEVKDVRSFIPAERQEWHGVVTTNFIVDRDYDMFGLLFGIQNFCNLPPVVGTRGFPVDGQGKRSGALRAGRPLPKRGFDGTKLTQSIGKCPRLMGDHATMSGKRMAN